MNKEDKIEITEMFMAEAGGKCFYGIIKRSQDAQGKPHLFSRIVINDGIVQGEFKSVDAKSIATSFVIANDITGILHFANGEIIEPEKMINNLFKLILK